MSVRLTIISEMSRIASEQKKAAAPLIDSLALVDSGLDSLGFAILVARLEDRLGLDPFSASEEISFPVTLGDLIALYEHGAA